MIFSLMVGRRLQVWEEKGIVEFNLPACCFKLALGCHIYCTSERKLAQSNMCLLIFLFFYFFLCVCA